MFYDNNYYQNNKQNEDRLALKFFSNILKKYFKQGKLLDYGCGTGYFLKKFKTSQYEIFGYDISSYAREKTVINNPNVKIISDLEDINNNSLEAISCLHVMEHLHNPDVILKKFYQKLIINGVIFLVMPNTKSLGRIIKKYNWFAYGDKTHVSLLEAEEWLKLVKLSGFEIIKVGVDGLWDVPYFKNCPLLIQKLIFYPTAALQIWFNSLFLSLNLGEDLIIIAKKI